MRKSSTKHKQHPLLCLTTMSEQNLPTDSGAAATNSNNASDSSNTESNLPPILYSKRKKRQLFTKDIENLLYAMGDRPYSLNSTVSALEDILVDFISRLSHTMVHYAASQGRNRIKLNDLAFALRNDPLKLGRMMYILEQSHKIERAKKLFDEEQGTLDKKGDLFGKLGDDDEDEEDGEGDGKEGEAVSKQGESGSGDAVGKKKRKVELDETGKPKKRKYTKRKGVADGTKGAGES